VNVILVFLGGGIGTVARYWVSGIVYRWTGSNLPYGTFIENSVGCLLIGLLMTAFEDRFLVQPPLRIFLTIGILGGFTTFSTFSFETISMLKESEYFFAFLNIISTVITCLCATYAGTEIGKLL
jgi:fluoride exporter